MASPYTKNFDKEIYASLSKDNKLMIEDYRSEMKANNKSVGTISQYTSDIKSFACWNCKNNEDKDFQKLKKRDFRNYFLDLQSKGVGTSRINRIQCSLRTMFSFVANDEDEYDEYNLNAMEKIKGQTKQKIRDIMFLKDSEISILLAYFEKRQQYQKCLFISLAYESAGRKNELLQVLKSSIVEEVGRTNLVTGKRGKVFGLLYLKTTKKYFDLWMEKRGNDSIPELFTSGKKAASGSFARCLILECRQVLYKVHIKEMLDCSIQDILEALDIINIPEIAIIEDQDDSKEEIEEEIIEEDNPYSILNVHSLRHSSLENYSDGTHYGLRLLGKESLSLDILQSLANHSDISTTQGYLKDKSEQKLLEAFGIC